MNIYVSHLELFQAIVKDAHNLFLFGVLLEVLYLLDGLVSQLTCPS